MGYKNGGTMAAVEMRWLKMLRSVLLFSRSSSREVRIREPFLFAVVYFSRGTLPKKAGKHALLGDLGVSPISFGSLTRISLPSEADQDGGNHDHDMALE